MFKLVVIFCTGFITKAADVWQKPAANSNLESKSSSKMGAGQRTESMIMKETTV